VAEPHFDAAGRARMVDVGGKGLTARRALARGAVRRGAAGVEAVAAGRAGKGDVLGVARIAGILAAKRAGEWIPLCHPLPLDAVEVRFRLDAARREVEVEAEARCTGRTGVEMEALTAVAAACLTVYDMTKAYGRGHVLSDIRLVAKDGGSSGAWRREGEEPWVETL
jgi:cyclic pyranopterin phosphate synthase